MSEHRDIISLDQVNKTISTYVNDKFNVPGATVYTELADFMRPSIRVVTIDTNPARGEIYGVSGGKFAFSRYAIDKFKDAGRIDLSIPHEPIVEKGRDTLRYIAKVIGERFDLDGAPKRIEDIKAIDLIVREEEARQKYWEKADKENPRWPAEQKKEYVERCVRKLMIEKKKFAAEMAITGAQSRVVQKLLGLKPAYSMEELRKPFVIVSVTPVLDMQDPDIKRMVTGKMLGIREALYPQLASALPPVYRPQVEYAAPCQPASEPAEAENTVQAGHPEGGFADLPRMVRESILRRMISDDEMAERIRSLPDKELFRLYVRFREAA